MTWINFRKEIITFTSETNSRGVFLQSLLIWDILLDAVNMSLLPLVNKDVDLANSQAE